MNIQEYINSGTLEEYCLGLLNPEEQAGVLEMCTRYPEIKKELVIIENAVESIAANVAQTPDERLKQRILNSLGFEEQHVQFDLDNLPPTSISSNHKSWIKTLEDLIPEEPTEDFSCQVLRQDEHFAQMLIIAKNDVPEETHDNLMESFFILKGKCSCTVGGNIVMLGPGDFLEIPLNVQHDVKMLTPHVVAILQY